MRVVAGSRFRIAVVEDDPAIGEVVTMHLGADRRGPLPPIHPNMLGLWS